MNRQIYLVPRMLKNFNGKRKAALIFYNNALKSEISQNIYLYRKTKYII